MNITFGGLVLGAHTFLAVQMFAEPQTAAAGPSQANNPKESSRKESERTVYLEQTVLTHTHTHTSRPHTHTGGGKGRRTREPQNLCLGPAAAIEKSLAKRQTTHGIWPKGCGCCLDPWDPWNPRIGIRATGSLALQLCGGKPRAWYNIELSNQLNGSRAGKTLSLMELALNCRTGPRQTSTKFHRRLQVNPDSGGSGLWRLKLVNKCSPKLANLIKGIATWSSTSP